MLDKYINTRPEPTGVGSSVTNFLPLPYPIRDPVSKGAAPGEDWDEAPEEVIFLRCSGIRLSHIPLISKYLAVHLPTR